MLFSDLGLSEDLLNAVTDAGYIEPTPIQAEAIPYVLMGRDILGCCLLYTSPSPRDGLLSRMPSSA